jgi:hypothetical protein
MDEDSTRSNTLPYFEKRRCNQKHEHLLEPAPTDEKSQKKQDVSGLQNRKNLPSNHADNCRMR